MDSLTTIRRRHASQRLAGEPLASVVDAVRWSGAVQAQEFAEVKWSLAQRLAGEVTDAQIERPFSEGRLLRTHVMRPTWHLVAAEDIRWLLRLTAPRVHQANKHMYARCELDGATLERCHRVIARELAAEPRTRKELIAALAGAGIEGDSVRLGYVFGHAELEQLICSGPRRGKQHTYMLLDDRARSDPGPSGDAALAELARRYFRSHGPATARDFSWWAGMTLTGAREAISLCRPALEREDDDAGTPWFSVAGTVEAPARHRALLLPTYDELIVAYQDLRVDLVREPPREGLLTRTISIDGRTVGGWRRTLARGSVTVEATAFTRLDRARRRELESAVARLGAFLELEPRLELELAH